MERNLYKNKALELIELPLGKKKMIECKWVFALKFKVDGSIERYEARLVAQGFTQTYGLNYQETFSPVAKINTMWVILSLIANLEWSPH